MAMDVPTSAPPPSSGGMQPPATSSSTTTSTPSRPASMAGPSSSSHAYGYGTGFLAPIPEPLSRRTGVRQTQGQVLDRLGYFSNYDSGTAAAGTTGRLLGSVGYTTSTSVVLQPAVMGNTRDALTRNLGRKVTPKDVEYVREHDAKSEESFQAWKQRREEEMQRRIKARQR